MTTVFKGSSLPISGINSPKLRRAHDYWSERRAQRSMPSRLDIRPEELVSLLGNVMLVDVSYEPPDLRYRLFGSEIALSHGADFTGKSVRDLDPPGFNELIWEQYMEVVTSGEPRVHRVIYETPRRLASYERLTLPLSADGQTVDMLFAISEYERRFWQAVEEDLASGASGGSK
ncbi:MAG: PAS domain-containing protein [Geminicoccales bacterium]